MLLAAFDFTVWRAAAAAGGAFLAGAINAIAGGGTLVSFPILVALGVPSVAANVTNTISLVPGYLGGSYAQRDQLVGQQRRLRSLLAVSAVGGLTGAVLLVLTSDDAFRSIVPLLILLACAMLLFQQRLRKLVAPPEIDAAPTDVPANLPLLGTVFATAVYGGYFGAGLGIMLLALLGVFLHDTLPRLNLAKQALSFVVNLVAATFLVFSGKAVWSLVPLMAVASLAGGNIGGRLVGRINPNVLRGVVVVFGVAVAIKFWVS